MWNSALRFIGENYNALWVLAIAILGTGALLLAVGLVRRHRS